MLTWKLVSFAMFSFSFLFTALLIIFKNERLKHWMAPQKEKILLPGYEATVIRERRKIGKR